MKKFGIENVREGSFSNVQLSDCQKSTLQIMTFQVKINVFTVEANIILQKIVNLN